MSLVDPGFWRDKRVLLTGHTGFKGAWTTLWLHAMGAQVHGLSLPPDTEPNFFTLAGLDKIVPGGLCDIRDAGAVSALVSRAQPDIVIHMAAQALVLRSVKDPILTFETNVAGTANLLEALRQVTSLSAVLVVTTDKVYENAESGHPFVESDPLGGHDPYSASKAAAEIVVQSFARTYFQARSIPVATARAGNVIGGGDFSADRVVPDIWRALKNNNPVRLRNPKATRPWQHVLDCIAGYLSFVQFLVRNRNSPAALNFGPDPELQLSVEQLVEEMQKAFGIKLGWVLDDGSKPREMQLLALDSRKARAELAWRDILPGHAAFKATAEWYQALERNEDMFAVSRQAIEEYMCQ